MRVLDIDLDFFLADCCPLAEYGNRPALSGHEPWPESRVIDFLENQCALTTDKPVPGRIFPTHDGALRFWAEKINSHDLQVPFHVTHVDAHSDLGIGYPGPGYVLYNVISKNPEKRTDIRAYYDQHKLDEANYLLFALAFRWVSSLDNIRNPKSRQDIPQDILDGSPDVIRLRSLTSAMFESKNGPEPAIPFHVYNDYTLFRNHEPWDFISLAISPRYAPAEADDLVSIFQRYMIQI